MPMSTQKATSALQESNDKYEEFLGGLRLIWVGLKSCSSILDRTALYKLFSEKKNLVRSFEGAYKVNEVGAVYFEASGSFVVTVRESKDADPVVRVECEFEAHLHGTKPLPKGFVERFVDSEFQLILVPYARQFVSSTTAQMSIPPLVLPLSTGPSESSETEKIRTRRATKVHAKTR